MNNDNQLQVVSAFVRVKLKMRRYKAHLILCVGGCLLAGFWAMSGISAPLPRPEAESDLVMGRTLFEFRPVPWIDDRYVLVGGYKQAEHEGNSISASDKEPALYLWDTVTNTSKKYASLGPSPGWAYCFNRGFVSYSVAGDPATHTFDLRLGQFGHEQPVHISGFGYHPEVEDCKAFPKVDESPTQTQYAYALLPGDGTIVVSPNRAFGENFSPSYQNEPVHLVRPGQQPIALPILAKEMYYNANLSYSDFSHQYVLIPYTWRGHDVSRSEQRPKGMSRPIYLISKDGPVQAIDIPDGFGGRPVAVFPSRVGLVWIANDSPEGGSKNAGAWLLRRGAVSRLYRFRTDAASLSPDGCHFAFQRYDVGDSSSEQLELLNLCNLP